MGEPSRVLQIVSDLMSEVYTRVCTYVSHTEFTVSKLNQVREIEMEIDRDR